MNLVKTMDFQGFKGNHYLHFEYQWYIFNMSNSITQNLKLWRNF